MQKSRAASAALALMAEHQVRGIQRNATEARQTFFQLLGNVIADPAEVVLIQHKDLPARGALVAEAFLDYVHRLEELTRDLATASVEPFALVGTATVDGDVEDLLRALRAEERSQSEARISTASAR